MPMNPRLLRPKAVASEAVSDPGPFAADRTYFNSFAASVNVFGNEWIEYGQAFPAPPSTTPAPDGRPALRLGPGVNIYSNARTMNGSPPFLNFAQDWTFEAWFFVAETALSPYPLYTPGTDELLYYADGPFAVLRNDFGFDDESRYSIWFSDNNSQWFRNAYSIQWGDRDWYTAADNAAYTPANSLPLGRWFHLACVVDGLTKRIYIDGVLAATGTLNNKGSGAGYWQMGHPHDGRCGMGVYVRQFQLTQAAKYSANFTPSWANRYVTDGKSVGPYDCGLGAALVSNGTGGYRTVVRDPVLGCRDGSALNYNSAADCDGGSCCYGDHTYGLIECIDCSSALGAMWDSCGNLQYTTYENPLYWGETCHVFGCTDPAAANYNPNAECGLDVCFYE